LTTGGLNADRKIIGREDEALFGYAVGPHSGKKFLYPPLLRLWSAEHDAQGIRIVAEPDPDERYVLRLGLLEPLYLAALQPAIFLAPPIIGNLRHAYRSDRFRDRSPLRR
jgi:sulfhydrogenase subunit beta (sulfur reductase)